MGIAVLVIAILVLGIITGVLIKEAMMNKAEKLSDKRCQDFSTKRKF